MLTYPAYLKMAISLPLKNIKTTIMKKLLLSVFTLVFILGTANVFAQESESKHEVKKEIKVTDKDGDVQVIIKESEGGKVTKQVLTGAEAEEYLKNETKASSLFIEREGEESSVLIMELEEADGHSWISEEIDFDIEVDMEELNLELEKLKEELDELNTEEIAERLDEIMEMREDFAEMHIIKMEALHHDMEGNMEIHENINVQVKEEDGVMIITKTIGDVEIVEEIILDEGTKGKRIIVKSSSSGDGNKNSEAMSKMTNRDIDLSVYPNPNNGEFFVDVNLKNSEEAVVRVIDSSGKEVYKKKLKGAEKYSLNVDLKKPSSGMYVIIVEQGEEIMKLKTIVE